MIQNSRLTNEELKKLFHNDFHLAEYLIDLVRYRIRSGDEVNVNQFLDEVRKRPEKFNLEELKELERLTEETEAQDS